MNCHTDELNENYTSVNPSPKTIKIVGTPISMNRVPRVLLV
jgi:hypothetical protein